MRAVVDDQRQPLDQGQTRHLHGRQIERARQLQLLVGQHRERQMQPRGHLGLVGVALRRQAEHLRGAGGLQFREQVAERAGLRRAAARARDHVPVVDQRDLAGLAGPGIGEHHGAPRQRRQRHRGIVGGNQADRRDRHARQDAPPRRRRSAPESCSSRLQAGFSGSSHISPSVVIASERLATKQSILCLPDAGLLRFARNDG